MEISGQMAFNGQVDVLPERTLELMTCPLVNCSHSKILEESLECGDRNGDNFPHESWGDHCILVRELIDLI